jgi:hypothetical protein
MSNVLMVRRRRTAAGLVSLTMSGLTSGEARPGDHASISVTAPDGVTFVSQAWGFGAFGDDTYGTGTNPTDYTASDYGTLLWEAVGDDDLTYRASAPIRRAVAVNTVAPVASGDTGLGDVLSVTNGTWTGAEGGAFTYQARRNGVAIPGEVAANYGIVAADSGADITWQVVYVNSGGASAPATSNAVTVDTFAAPAISGVPTISGTEEVGQTLTATPASVTGTPTPTRVGQWLRNGTAIAGATGLTRLLTEADEGAVISWRQTETNPLGTDIATSAATGAIAEASASLITLGDATYTEGGGGSGPSLSVSSIAISGTTAPYYLDIVTHLADTTIDQSEMDGGSGDVQEKVTLGPETNIEDLDGALALAVSITGGNMTIQYRDSTGTPVKSALTQVGTTNSINVDATAPAFSSGSPADNATDVAVDTNPALTFSKNLFGVATKDFYLYEDIDTTPVLVETFTFDNATSATGDNGGSASITDAVITISPGADMADNTQHSIRWEAGAVTDSWGNAVAANTGDTAYNFTTAAAVAAAFVERIVSVVAQPTFYSEDTSPSFTDTIDVSGYTAGENLIIFTGPDGAGALPTGVTVNGNSAGSPVVSANFGSNRRIGCYEYTLQAADITAGTIDVVATLTAANNDFIMDMFITAGSVADTATSNHGPSSSGSVEVTPTQATNGIIHVVMGTAATFGGSNGFVYSSWSSGSLQYNFSGARYGIAVGLGLDAPTSAQTISWGTPDGASTQYATVAIVVE